VFKVIISIKCQNNSSIITVDIRNIFFSVSNNDIIVDVNEFKFLINKVNFFLFLSIFYEYDFLDLYSYSYSFFFFFRQSD